MTVPHCVSAAILALTLGCVQCVLLDLSHAICVEPDCVASEECSPNEVCHKEMCVNPCLLSVCGEHTTCRVIEHVVVCSCKVGYTGNPLDGCQYAGEIKSNKRFRLFNDTLMSWQGSMDHCKSLNMRLGTINSQEEQDSLHEKIKHYGNKWWWIGGADYGDIGNYVWFSTSSSMTYTRWAPGQPDNNVKSDGEVQHCLAVHGPNGEWSDGYCYLNYNHVCEQHLSVPSLT